MPHSLRNEALVFLGLIMHSLQEQGAVVDVVVLHCKAASGLNTAAFMDISCCVWGKNSFYFYEPHLQHPEKKKKVP